MGAFHPIALDVVKLPEAKHRVKPLPRRGGGERLFALMARYRGFVSDYERSTTTLNSLHVVAFVILLLRRAADSAAVGNILRQSHGAYDVRIICPKARSLGLYDADVLHRAKQTISP